MLSHSSKYSALTDEQLRLIGFITVEWSNIQFLLSILLSRLLLSPEYPSRTHAEGKSALKLIEANCEALEIQEHRYRGALVEKESLELIRALLKEIDQLRITRNRIAHFCWSRSHDSELFGTRFSGGVPSAKREKRDVSVFSNEELEAVGGRCHQIVEKLIGVVSELPEVTEEEAIAIIKAKKA
ncbi:MAG: hypothetical protein R3F42_03405 [Pseudomonadota bacterium]